MADIRKKRGPVWPHEKLGYQLQDPVVVEQSQDRKLSGYEVDFMQVAMCGNEWEKVAGNYIYNYLQGMAAETCFPCTNSGNSQIKGCKYQVSQPTEVIPLLSYRFYHYTSEDCSSGETPDGKSHEVEIGACTENDPDQQFGLEFSYRRKVTDASQLGSGLINMEFQKPTGSDTPCTTPLSYWVFGVYENQCIPMARFGSRK